MKNLFLIFLILTSTRLSAQIPKYSNLIENPYGFHLCSQLDSLDFIDIWGRSDAFLYQEQFKDINNDGLPDYIIGAYTNGSPLFEDTVADFLNVRLNTGSVNQPNFEECPLRWQLEEPNIHIFKGELLRDDFNNDGYDDVIFMNDNYLGYGFPTTIWIYYAEYLPQTGTYSITQLAKYSDLGTSASIHPLKIFDYDSDGSDDYAFFINDFIDLRVFYLPLQDIKNQSPIEIPLPNVGIQEVAWEGDVTDVNGDGLVDFVLGTIINGNFLRYYIKNIGTVNAPNFTGALDTLPKRVIFNDNKKAFKLSYFDIDNDGDDDEFYRVAGIVNNAPVDFLRMMMRKHNGWTNRDKISISVYWDKNKNNVFDGSDEWLEHYPVAISNHTVPYLRTNAEGKTFFNVNKNKTYRISIPVPSGFQSVPASYSINTSTSPTSYSKVFALQQTGNVAKIDMSELNLKLTASPEKTVSEQLNAENANIIVFPNPMIDYARITFENERNELATVQLFDMNGKVVLMGETTTNEFEMQQSGLASGMYIVSITVSGSTQKAKLIVQ